MSVWLAAISISVVGLGYMALQFHLQVDARIHVLPELFTVAECKSIVRVANGANACTTGRHAYFPTDDVQLSAVPALANVSAAVKARVFPLLRERFSLGGEAKEVNDLFLIRYRGDDASAQSELKMHTDGSTLSFSIALSAPTDFGGGGIDFDLLPAPIRELQGSLVLHPSRLMHRGATVINGTRYVLVGFVGVGSDPIWAWSGADVAATRHGMFARCVRVVREGAVASSGGSGDEGGAAEHCKPGPAVLWQHLRNQASYMDDDDMSDLLALNAGLVAAGVVAWCLHWKKLVPQS